MPNGTHSYDEWRGLDAATRDFHLYVTLCNLDDRLKKVSPVRVFFLGVVGGAAAIAVCETPALLHLIRTLLLK